MACLVLDRVTRSRSRSEVFRGLQVVEANARGLAPEAVHKTVGWQDDVCGTDGMKACYVPRARRKTGVAKADN